MDRIAQLLGAHEDWHRPGPTPEQRRHDLWLALGFYLLAALSMELMRSLGAFDGNNAPTDVLSQHAVAASAAALLIWRRSHPLIIATLANLHLYVSGTLEAMVAGGLVLQILYFFAVFSGVAWARDRRVLGMVLIGFCVVLGLWLAWMFALTSGLEELYAALDVDTDTTAGIFSRPVAAVGYISLNNFIFLGGAILLGQVAWRSALHTARRLEQAATIRDQAARLRDQAVVAERLRIARELHDVVAHHVSVMGVQAAAARRVLQKQTPAAGQGADSATTASVGQALGAIESSSRDAVGQMRDLLGTLRSGELAADGTPTNGDPQSGTDQDRAPQPDLEDLEELVRQASTPTCQVSYTLVEEQPGAAAEVPAALQLTAYRIAQESLSNVRTHSTATRASVVVRVDHELEVEVLDNGAPRPGTAGSGLGQQGIRERADLLGGQVEIGPRHGPGYRVRVTLPLTIPDQTHPALTAGAGR